MFKVISDIMAHWYYMINNLITINFCNATITFQCKREEMNLSYHTYVPLYQK